MTCEGCERRKGIIRRWLGVDKLLQASNRMMARRIQRQYTEVLEAGAELEKRVKALEAETVRFSEIT